VSLRSAISICDSHTRAPSGALPASGETRMAKSDSNSFRSKILPLSLTRSRFCGAVSKWNHCFQDFAGYRGEGGVPQLSVVKAQLSASNPLGWPRTPALEQTASGHDLGRAEQDPITNLQSRLQPAAQRCAPATEAIHLWPRAMSQEPRPGSL
jgi:hypothetical protein